MATTPEINAVVDAFVNEFGGDIDLFTAWVHRQRLLADLATANSAVSNLVAAQNDDVQEFNDALAAAQAAVAAAQAAVDVL